MQLQAVTGAMHEKSTQLHRAEEIRLASLRDAEKERKRADQLEARVTQLVAELHDK